VKSSPDLEHQKKSADLVVFMPVKDWNCAECGGTGDLLTMDDRGPLCMTCADLDHLVFLGAGAAPTRTLSCRSPATPLCAAAAG
jgi:hypothetical protein